VNRRQLIVTWAMGAYVLLSLSIIFILIEIIPRVINTMPHTTSLPIYMVAIVYLGKVTRVIFYPLLIIGGILIYSLRDKKR
jgi:hypothetical protein